MHEAGVAGYGPQRIEKIFRGKMTFKNLFA
jgi:hypothetical protein